jgi:hypothetical protein
MQADTKKEWTEFKKEFDHDVNSFKESVKNFFEDNA